MYHDEMFDCIVVGGGHAGCEAASAAARMGLKTLLVSSNVDHIGQMSCNPAIGGLAKGHMVREIDALGGMMGLWADEASIQFRMLNTSKGPAVRAPRSQIDREIYSRAVKRDLYSTEKLTVINDMVTGLDIEDRQIRGVYTALNGGIRCTALCLTAGTFLRGRLFFGERSFPGGRLGDSASESLSASLEEAGFSLRRFMTCTPPRVLASSIDFSALSLQPGDKVRGGFSFHGPGISLPQENCYIAWTNERCHEIIRKNLGLSPMYNGAIPGPGPRYCPSIEDKIARFPEKSAHQLFIEPEGLNNPLYYLNNVPTGLPVAVQEEFLHAIPGLEQCRIVRPGYAIEYDCIDARCLRPTLESQDIRGLWFAGQLNGTSGYEEAAAQGLFAAMNIFASLNKAEPFLPGRDAAYIHVLTDDLTAHGANEPYRMFTSRAEHRLLLREGNADQRLTPLGRSFGLVSDEQWALYSRKASAINELIQALRGRIVRPGQGLRDLFMEIGESPLADSRPMAELLRRTNVTTEVLARLWPGIMDYPADVRQEAEICLVYQGYLDRQKNLAAQSAYMEKTVLPNDLNYDDVAGLPLEAREKLTALRPMTLGQARRISGITPAAITCLIIHLRKESRAARKAE